MSRRFQNAGFTAGILFFFLIQVSGQIEHSYQFVTYSNKDGFNQNTVISMEQDKYGILWLGTSNGLIKYDGNTFLNMSWESEHFSDVYHGPISSIVSDSRGLFWIVSRSGLNIYYPDQERFFKIPSLTVDFFKKLTIRHINPWG